MPDQAIAHLARLADGSTRDLLARMGFDWTRADAAASASARFKRTTPDAPALVGLLGGASSGKSTLFNSLVGREVSRISAHAHETVGPVVAVHDRRGAALDSWLSDGLMLDGMAPAAVPRDQSTIGRVGAVAICRHEHASLDNILLVDTPDVTSKMSDEEGAITQRLVPWFDGLIVIVDEERWFDAAVFSESTEPARNFGPRIWIVFNRTEPDGHADSELDRRLADHAARCHASAHCVSPFRPGVGYRALDDPTQSTVISWFAELEPAARSVDLERHLQRRCADLVQSNVTRSEQYSRMCHEADRCLAGLVESTSLSADLLTAEERELLGLGHRYVPLYDIGRKLHRRLRELTRLGRARSNVDFDKPAEPLADVLRRNLEQRFRLATGRIEEIVAGSDYLAGAGLDWCGDWTVPLFDENAWAARIRSHIESWKQEAGRHARTGDIAALGIGTPLLVADLLFLGGAGLTISWAAAWIAGFVGGKGLASLVQRSRSFEEYQTTVRAYQSFIREALAEQWVENQQRIPRRHLRTTDPLFGSIMYWSSPERRQP